MKTDAGGPVEVVAFHMVDRSGAMLMDLRPVPEQIVIVLLAAVAVVLRDVAIIEPRVDDRDTHLRIVPIPEVHDPPWRRRMETPRRAYIRSETGRFGLRVRANESRPIRVRLQAVVTDAAFVVDLKQHVTVTTANDLVDDLRDEALLERQQHRVLFHRCHVDGIIEIRLAFFQQRAVRPVVCHVVVRVPRRVVPAGPAPVRIARFVPAVPNLELDDDTPLLRLAQERAQLVPIDIVPLSEVVFTVNLRKRIRQQVPPISLHGILA